MTSDLAEGASGRGAAGGDIRLGDVPQEFVEACAEKLEGLLAEKSPTSPIYRHLRTRLQREQLALPVVSSTLTRVLALLGRESASVAELALAIESDPALATKIVGVANSGFYGGIDSVVSVENALMRIGLEQAKTIVAGVAVRSSVFRAPGYEQIMDALWQNSLASGLATLALLEREPRWRESAFLLGLVHDVGRIVLIATAVIPLAERNRLFSANAIDQAGSEIRCELGAIALAAWGFDEEMVDAVLWQESPEACPEESRGLCVGLYVADTLLNLGQRGWVPGENADADARVLELVGPLGFDLQQCAEVLMIMESGLSTFSKIG